MLLPGCKLSGNDNTMSPFTVIYHVRKNFVPTKLWEIFKLSPPIIMGEAETMLTQIVEPWFKQISK